MQKEEIDAYLAAFARSPAAVRGRLPSRDLALYRDTVRARLHDGGTSVANLEAGKAPVKAHDRASDLVDVLRYDKPAEMDAQGRLLLPQHLRQKAGLTGDAAVLGMQNHLTVIDEVALDKSLEEHPLTDEDLAVLKIPGL